jgi:hypothetical protein
MKERQRLINQYLQLNIQMMEKDLKYKEKQPDVQTVKVVSPPEV